MPTTRAGTPATTDARRNVLPHDAARADERAFADLDGREDHRRRADHRRRRIVGPFVHVSDGG